MGNVISKYLTLFIEQVIERSVAKPIAPDIRCEVPVTITSTLCE